MQFYQENCDLLIIEESQKFLIVPFQLVKELEELQILLQKISHSEDTTLAILCG